MARLVNGDVEISISLGGTRQWMLLFLMVYSSFMAMHVPIFLVHMRLTPESDWMCNDPLGLLNKIYLYWTFASILNHCFVLTTTNKILCLVVYYPTRPSSAEGGDHNSSSKTIFLLLQIQSGVCHSSISLTPLYTRLYEIISATNVLNFLLLQ